jgi:hypothetical protein
MAPYEFSAKPSKPSRRAVMRRSMGKPVVEMAQAPSGHKLTRANAAWMRAESRPRNSMAAQR